MASNEQRDKPVQVKKGAVGPSRRAPSLESPGSTRGKDELDAREARIREARRKGPELKRGEDRRALEGPAQVVAPTECDDENDQ